MHWVCLPGHGQLTHIDFTFYEIMDHHRLFEPAILEGFPALKVTLVCIVSLNDFHFATFIPCRNIWIALRQVYNEVVMGVDCVQCVQIL